MILGNLLEKLDFKDEKNILVQGLPSSIEKCFAKLSYSKNVTPLLKTKKIDFALVFAVNQHQLNTVLQEVFSALHDRTKVWIAHPKSTSKITSDLNRQNSWNILSENGMDIFGEVAIDHVWNAYLFRKATEENKEEARQKAIELEATVATVEEDL
jgi:hypothetical protein